MLLLHEIINDITCNIAYFKYMISYMSQPRTISIEGAEAVRRERVSEARSRAEETKKRHREAAARERAGE